MNFCKDSIYEKHKSEMVEGRRADRFWRWIKKFDPLRVNCITGVQIEKYYLR
jgi:hypothetical protein|tara:strand:+ start:38 stop:193 length:156 start_codon:yes stop_codon:yes gene_type:complete